MNEFRGQPAGVKQRIEVALHVPNDLKVLARIFASLATWSKDIDAWRFYSNHKQAAILLITNSEGKLLRAIRAAGFECDANPVVVLEEHHRTVSAVRLSTELRANGMQILDAYTCRSLRDGTVFVLKTTDAPRAAAVLDAMGSLPQAPLSIDVEAELAIKINATMHAAEEAA